MKANLVYIFADQWRAHAMGIEQQDQVITPNIDTFAEECIRFSNACSTFPLCSPHRASLMTGKYPFSVGMWTNCKIGLEEKIMLKPQETCIANILQEHGYRTGYIGKWHLDASEQNFTSNPKSGAVEWDAYTPPGERRQGFEDWLSYGADDNHLDPHYWSDSPEQIRPRKWSAEYETDKAIQYLEERKTESKPFALFLSYNPPHLPYDLVPQRYYRQFETMPVQFRENVPEEMRTEEMKEITRKYFAAVAGIDEQFGRIYHYLKENKMEENTVVVLSADHGEMLGSHGLMSKNIWYEEAIRIPLLIRQKGKIKPAVCSTIFASPDHMPTLLDLLELPIPDTCEGYSHKADILFGTDCNAPEDMFLCSYPGSAEMVAAYTKSGLNQKCYGWRGVRTKQYTYVVHNGYEPGYLQQQYLYDNIKDPYQMCPKIIDREGCNSVVYKMKERLNHYLELIKDPFIWGTNEERIF